MGRIAVGGLTTAIVVAYAVGSWIWVSTDDQWYRSLTQPPWQPPGVVFGLIWPYNFIMIGVAGWVIANRGSRPEQIVWLTSIALSVVAALRWSYLFYVPHNLGGASVALVVAAVLTLPAVVVAFRVSTNVGLALVPYQVWIALASSLSIGYATRN